MRKGVRLFGVAAAICVSMTGCLASERDGSVATDGYDYPAHYLQDFDTNSPVMVIVNVSDIPGRYNDWNGTISLWNDLGEGLGGSLGVVTGNSVTFIFLGNPGVYDGILSFWDGDRDRHLRIWSRSITAEANTILFGEFNEFTN